MPESANAEYTKTMDILLKEGVLDEMIDELNKGPRTRYRALAATHLQIAKNFLRNSREEE